MKMLGRFTLRSLVGLAGLKLLAVFGSGIGVNLINALIIGVLGFPGVGLLLMGNVLL